MEIINSDCKGEGSTEKMEHLSGKEKRFVDEYLIDLNATRAALRAGYGNKPTSASVTGCNLLGKPNIQSALQTAKDQRAKRTEVSQDRVITELAKLAFSKLTDFVEWDGSSVTIKPSEGLDHTDAAAVAEVSRSDTLHGTNIRVKLHDKVKSLELLARHLGLLNDKISVDEKASLHLQASPEMRLLLDSIYRQQ